MTDNKKFTDSRKISNYEVLTDDGFEDIKYLHTTIPYEVYHLVLEDGKELKCADNHKVFYPKFEEVFVKDLKKGECILTESLKEVKVESVKSLGYEEEMFDLELGDDSKHRYYTNGILSHNTELAKILSNGWFDNDIIRFDMSEFMEKHSASKLIGSPPGYVGFESAGQLTEKVRRNPYSLILLDEIEKAHPDVLNTLLQMLDEGHLNDGQGRTVNFKNCIIVMTSNLGAKKSQVKSVGFSMGEDSERTKLESVTMQEVKKHFAPEIINRIDQVVVFNSLSEKDIAKIMDLEINKIKKLLEPRGVKLTVGPKVKEKVIEEGYSDEYGARHLSRTVETMLKDPITDFMFDIEDADKDCTLSLKWNNKKEEIIITKK